MKKYFKIIVIISVILLCAMSFMACSFKYGTPDKLDMANSSVGERILVGLQVALLGIGVVFIVLFILIGFIVLSKYLFKGVNVMKAKMTKTKKTQTSVDKTKDIKAIEVSGDADEEVVAAITAALYAYYDNQNVKSQYKSNVQFRVRKISEIK